MFSKSWSEVTKVVKSLKEVQNTIKLQLVKSWKEVKDKYGGVDLESVAQRVSSPFGIIVGIAAVTSNASEKLLVVSQEQKEHLKAFRVSFQESCAHT